MKNPKVFLSYAREDYGAARNVRAALSAKGIEVWFDEDSLVAGQRWLKAIAHAIRNSDFFIPLLSRASVSKRGVVQKEIREALKILETLPDDQIYIVPVRLDECEPTFDVIKDIHWVDLFRDWDIGIEQICRAIQAPGAVYVQPVVHDAFDHTGTATPAHPLPEARQEPVRVDEAIRETVDRLEPYAARFDIKVRFHDDSHGAKVQIDRPAFIEALSQVLNNAIRYSYTTPAGHVWVDMSASADAGGVVKITVENWGLPIPKEDIESGRIFLPGYRSVNSRSTEGTGLGLYIARNALRMAGGEIAIESRPVRAVAGTNRYDCPFITQVIMRVPTAPRRRL